MNSGSPIATFALDSGAQSRKPLRGAFINTAEASCSIHESGRMVYRCICESAIYDLDYFSLDKIDLAYFAGRQGIRRLDPAPDTPEWPGDYDFWVFNWHFITMASLLPHESIARLTGPKFTVVLELAPGDPLKLVPPGVFDGYIALDPTAEATASIFPFPRPLEGDPWQGAVSLHDIPVIGSFGFGTPGKGFELLVEAVNREFDRAVVRVNIPAGTYVFTDGFHRQNYPRYIEKICRKIAKPGIEIRFTYDFMSPEELVAWCAGNDLNCFMYTRSQPGLAATTDQAVMSGRPLLTLSNDTFRHIHRYIEPYPTVGLREAMDTTVPQVRKIQRDWSRASFNATFHGMLGAFGLGGPNAAAGMPLGRPQDRVQKIMVVSRRPAGDIRDYARRVADCLGRSGEHDVVLAGYEDIAAFKQRIERVRPAATIFVDFRPADRLALTVALDSTTGPNLLLVDDPASTRLALGPGFDRAICLPRQPIVPFQTSTIELRLPRCIWLVGFADRQSDLERVVLRIAEAFSEADVYLEVAAAARPAFEARVAAVAGGLPHRRLRLSVVSLAGEASTIIGHFAESSLIVFHNDPARTAELEDLGCLAMTTERPVVFSRGGRFPRFLGQGTVFDDLAIAELTDLGMAAQIEPYHNFGEWQFAAGIHRIFAGGPVAEGRDEMADVWPAPSPAATTTTGPVLFLLVGIVGQSALASRVAMRLAQAWGEQGGSVRCVVWNAAERALQSPDRDAWERAATGSCLSGHMLTAKNGWLLVPESLHPATWPRALVEMDAMLEARRLGLRCAFLFHGADPLRLRTHAGNAAENHEQYMQALLLADAIAPVSDLAADDLVDFFMQHQKADFVPPSRKIRLPVESSNPAGEAWSHYATALRSLLLEAADRSRHLTSLYMWLDFSAPRRGRANDFTRHLTRALSEHGIDVIPIAWDGESRRLVACDGSRAGGLDDTRAAWIHPGTHGAPSWMVVPVGIDGPLLADVSAFARRHDLRVAAVLPEAESEAPVRAGAEQAYFEALAGLDKVLAVSAGRFDEFGDFLLSWRGKVHSAEHRFQLVPHPNEIPGQPKASVAKQATPGLVRVVVWVRHISPPDLAKLFEAAGRAAGLSAIRLKFIFVGPRARGEVGKAAARSAAFASIPGAQWQDTDGDRVAGLLDTADFTIVAGDDGAGAPQAVESLWRGLACIVHDTGKPAPEPGLVRADLRNAKALAEAILTLADAERRRCVAEQAIGRKPRSWRDYAHDIRIALATDRLGDGLRRPATRVRRDVYATLPNLRRRPRLSLCISTYRRAGWLGVNLRNIFSQIPVPRDDLEILVVDNASPDNTAEIVKPYRGRADFRYLRNPRNVGMLGNLAVTAQRAKGDYIWILGDDDLTRAGAIERVLDIIGEHPQLGLIYMNYGYTSEQNPAAADDLASFLDNYNRLEPAGPDELAPVKLLAAKSENFYTAIYSHVYRRDHGMRAYCQDTSGRIFSTMLSCIPTAYYVLNYMADDPAYWIGEPCMVVNSNVSWQAYGPLLDLEQLPRAWDLAERMGSVPGEVDRRRSNRLWLVDMMWREIFENDKAGNAAYFSAPRVLMRLKHLRAIDRYANSMKTVYQTAHEAGHPAATMPPAMLFRWFDDACRSESVQ